MSTTVKQLVTRMADHIGDPTMEKVKLPQWLNFLNDAADDLVAMGWLLPIEMAESLELRNNIYQYDVPANFAYIEDIFLGDKKVGDSDTVDIGINLDAAIANATVTTLTVETMSPATLLAVNDLIKIDSEIMRIMAVVSTTSLTVDRGYFSTTAVAHDDGSDIYRPLANVTYDTKLEKAYWGLELDTGGSGGQAATGGSQAVLLLNSHYVSFVQGTPVRFKGQKRPNADYTAVTDVLDFHIESFLRERSAAYATRLLQAVDPQRGPELAQLRREMMAVSEKMEDIHPAEFRVNPSSVRVPGR